jgi:hypothetical protein
MLLEPLVYLVKELELLLNSLSLIGDTIKVFRSLIG